MASWNRNGSYNTDHFTHHVKLSIAQWATEGGSGQKVPGVDNGGDIHLADSIHKSIQRNEAFAGYSIARRATRSIFLPQIIVKDEEIPGHLVTPERIGAMGLGPMYDVFINFSSEDEAALFRISFSGGVDASFDGIN